jgi:N-succinyldiaminopimelate aminotransferase
MGGMGLTEVLANRRLSQLGTTIFTTMSALAQETGAVNLGQGFPDDSGPGYLIDAAAQAMRDGLNQYPPAPGVPALRQAIARHQAQYYGIDLDPQTEVVVTAGASEALAAALLAFVQPGDEVLTLEPYYDLYPAGVSLAGGVLVPVRLEAPDYAFDLAALEAAITPRSTVLLLNTPHNPTGTVLTATDLAGIAALALRHDLLVITDEVYEHLTFDGVQHRPPACVDGLAGRTISISSAGKSLSVTGWKIGWVTGPAALVQAVFGVKQFMSFASGTPLQHAVAAAIDRPDPFWRELAPDLQRRRDLLAEGLIKAGFAVNHPAGSFFLLADISAVTDQDAITYCMELPRTAGVVAIPVQVFYAQPATAPPVVRFTFCKREDVLREGIKRLTG